MKSSSRVARIFLVLILWCGLALRVWQLDAKSLWVDEIGQVVLARAGLLAAILDPRNHVAAPPLDYVATWFAYQLGASEFILRFPPVLWGCLTIAVLYALAHLLTRSQTIALCAAALFAIAPFAVQYAQEVRFYSLAALSLTLAVYFFARAWRTPTRWNWIVLGIVLGIGFYIHFDIFIAAALFILFALFVTALTRLAWLAPQSLGSRWSGLGIALAAGFVIALPWLMYAGRGAEVYPPFAALGIQDIFVTPILGNAAQTFILTRVVGFVVLPLLACVGLGASAYARREWGLLLALLVLGGVAGVLAGDVVLNHFFAPRQLFMFTPFYLILVAVGVNAVWHFQRAPRWLIVSALLLVGTSVALACANGLRAYYDTPKDDWRSAAFLLTRAIQPSDTIVFTRASLPMYLLYYAPELEKQIRAQNQIENARRVWIVSVGARGAARLGNAVPNGFKTIALAPERRVGVWYAGRVAEAQLWREAASFTFPPAVLAHSQVIRRVNALDAALGADVVAQARAALNNSILPLLPSQRAQLQEKIKPFAR